MRSARRGGRAPFVGHDLEELEDGRVAAAAVVAGSLAWTSRTVPGPAVQRARRIASSPSVVVAVRFGACFGPFGVHYTNGFVDVNEEIRRNVREREFLPAGDGMAGEGDRGRAVGGEVEGEVS